MKGDTAVAKMLVWETGAGSCMPCTKCGGGSGQQRTSLGRLSDSLSPHPVGVGMRCLSRHQPWAAGWKGEQGPCSCAAAPGLGAKSG